MLAGPARASQPRRGAPALGSVLARMVATGTALGDVLADSGYAHRVAITRPCRCGPWAPGWSWTCTPTIEATRAPTAGLYVTNGSLFCPTVPKALLGLVPPGRDASAAQLVEHDKKSAELGHYKFSRTSASDQDGYHQATCPALKGQIALPAPAGVYGPWL